MCIRDSAKAWAAAGSDARMNGCEKPVVINSGSGNQGMTASLPVIVYARELKAVSYTHLHRRRLRGCACAPNARDTSRAHRADRERQYHQKRQERHRAAHRRAKGSSRRGRGGCTRRRRRRAVRGIGECDGEAASAAGRVPFRGEDHEMCIRDSI